MRSALGATTLARMPEPLAAPPDMPSEARRVTIRREVVDWFQRNARPLPWRSPSTDAWGILVSEILSQQTQIDRVVPKWLEFMDRWPTPQHLRADSDAALLTFWDRLGYPRRALALRQCAIAICERFGGAVPADPEVLRSLPGIGPYTAAAVASFAYGVRVGVVDTNVRRVLARAIEGEARAWSPSTARDARAVAAMLPESGEATAAWNAAAMELGALVCRAKQPKCSECPIFSECAWQRRGAPPADTPLRRPQPTFAGSLREARGKVLAALRTNPAGISTAAAADLLRYRDEFDAETILRTLVDDRLIAIDDSGWIRLGAE